MSITLPLPSIVDALPDELYHADPIPGGSLSSTGARLLVKSPAKFDWQRSHPQPPKKAFDLAQESAATRERYGATPFGLGAMAAE